jgi:hypothetical protein
MDPNPKVAIPSQPERLEWRQPRLKKGMVGLATAHNTGKGLDGPQGNAS